MEVELFLKDVSILSTFIKKILIYYLTSRRYSDFSMSYIYVHLSTGGPVEIQNFRVAVKPMYEKLIQYFLLVVKAKLNISII